MACAKASGDAWTIAIAAWARAVVAIGFDELRERVDEAVSLMDAAGDEYHMATLLSDAAYGAWRAGRDADAARYLRRAVPLVRRLDQPFLWMHSSGAAGYAALLRGDAEEARAGFGDQLRLSHDLVFRPFVSFALTGLAAVATRERTLERAARLAGAAAAARIPGFDDAAHRTRIEARFLAPARDRHGADAWDGAAREGAAMSLDEAIAYALAEAPAAAPTAASTSAT
jgi:hypothetical protein